MGRPVGAQLGGPWDPTGLSYKVYGQKKNCITQRVGNDEIKHWLKI